jgi:glycosyltransferase involved in cell wall biosynthesis
LGVEKGRVFLAPNTVDRNFFRCQSDALMPLRDRLREELGAQGLAVLFVGRLVEELKGVKSLIRACAALEKGGRRLSLLLAGDGPDRKRYEKIAAEEGLQHIRFLGTLEQKALCKVYAAADVLVLPSRSEAWGLVLNEGMEFGLPLIVSDAVGAAPDLLPEEENGFVVPVGDVKALESGLDRLISDEALRQRMSEASRRIIESFTPERWAKGVLRVVETAEGETP